MQQPISAGFHLSPQQKLIWGAAPAERASLEVGLTGPLDETRLRDAMERVVQRHEILRTTYSSSAGMTTAFQVVGQTASPEFTTRIESVGENRHVLTVELPAMCADSASLRNLFVELTDAYDLRELEDPLQYADFSEWQNEALQNPEGVSRWAARNIAGQGPALELPFEKKASGSAREVLGLGELGAEPDVLLAAWQILLWRLTGRQEVAVGRVLDGRNHPEFAGALGLYEKVFPEYADFERDIAFQAAIGRAGASRAEMEEWMDSLPMDELS